MFMSLIVAALPLAQDAPVAPPAVMQTAAAATTKPDMAFDGGCAVMQGTKSSTPDDINGFYPAQVIDGYFNNVHRIYLDISKAKATLLKSPAHGILKLLSDVEARAQGIGPEAGPLYIYRPSPGYLGPDDATLLIEIGGKNYKVHTKFYVVEKVNDNNFYGTGAPATVCAESQPKRVATLTFNQDVNLTQWGDIVQEIASSSVGVEFNQYIATGSGVTLNFADLATGALGQTVDSTITLDTNAAGHNWFIDTTPADNSEFLPTSNPNEWVAKEGSAAYGKMDMLSVLLHEYGHALGIDHSADSHDYMGTTLTAGVRRMPSADELALMQQLVGQVKAGLAESTLSPTLPLQGGGGFPTLPLGANFIGFLGLLRSSRYGGVSIAPDASTWSPSTPLLQTAPSPTAASMLSWTAANPQ